MVFFWTITIGFMIVKQNHNNENRNTTQKIYRNKLRNGDWRLDCVSLDGGYLCFSHHQIKWSNFMFCFLFFCFLIFITVCQFHSAGHFDLSPDKLRRNEVLQLLDCELPMFIFRFEWDWICVFWDGIKTTSATKTLAIAFTEKKMNHFLIASTEKVD